MKATVLESPPVLTPPQQPGELEEPEEVVKNRQLEPAVSESGVAVGDAGNQDGKMKRIYNNFSERQEEIMVEWLIDNPLLYNNCLKEYKSSRFLTFAADKQAIVVIFIPSTPTTDWLKNVGSSEFIPMSWVVGLTRAFS